MAFSKKLARPPTIELPEELKIFLIVVSVIPTLSALTLYGDAAINGQPEDCETELDLIPNPSPTEAKSPVKELIV